MSDGRVQTEEITERELREELTEVLMFDSHDEVGQALAFFNLGERVGAWQRPSPFSRRQAVMWWQAVGEVWTTRRGMRQTRGSATLWGALWASSVPNRSLVMNGRERRALSTMPERLPIWRGANRPLAFTGDNPMAWTIDRQRALWFARRSVLFAGGKPRLGSAWISRETVLAYFDRSAGSPDASECEIIALPKYLEEITVTLLRPGVDYRPIGATPRGEKGWRAAI